MILNLASLVLIASSVSASPLFKRAPALGYKESSVPMTYYGSDGAPQPFAPYGVGHCDQEPVDKKFYAAVNTKAYGASCGLCAKITRGDACVVAPIVDSCPTCAGDGQAGIDVSLGTFAVLVGGESNARSIGLTPVSWEIVTCPKNRASTGSQDTTDVDPCSGASNTKDDKNTTSVALTGSSAQGCSLFGFPCCANPEKVPSNSIDKNGYKWGFENNRSCIVPKN